MSKGGLELSRISIYSVGIQVKGASSEEPGDWEGALLIVCPECRPHCPTPVWQRVGGWRDLCSWLCHPPWKWSSLHAKKEAVSSQTEGGGWQGRALKSTGLNQVRCHVWFDFVQKVLLRSGPSATRFTGSDIKRDTTKSCEQEK